MTTYYLSPTGNDSNPGTSGSPWQTLGKAASTLVAGDTAICNPGTYVGGATFNTAGTAGNPITLQSSVKWGAKIIEPVSHGLGTYVHAMTAPYNTIDGFEVTGPDCQWGIECQADYTIAKNCYVHHICNTLLEGGTGGYGIGNYGSGYHGSGAQIFNNLIMWCGHLDANGNIVQAPYVHCIYVMCDNTAAQGLIQNNVCIQAAGYGISLQHNPNNYLVTNNTIVEGQSGGMEVHFNSGDGTCDHNIIQNNIIAQCAQTMVVGTRNAIYSPSDLCGNTSTQTNIWRNMIAFGTYDATYEFTPATTHPAQTGTNLNTGDPQFANYQANGTGNYRLVRGSPCINAGISTNAPATDFDGNTRNAAHMDIGAYAWLPKWAGF